MTAKLLFLAIGFFLGAAWAERRGFRAGARSAEKAMREIFNRDREPKL